MKEDKKSVASKTSTKREVKLNPQQELFCKLYASDREFFGNGVQSYIEAYDFDITKPGGYATARSNASQLLTNTNVCERISQLLDLGGLNDQNVDKELLFVIKQHNDLSSKTAAIREYNKLKKRIDEKAQVNVNLSLSELLDKVKERKTNQNK